MINSGSAAHRLRGCDWERVGPAAAIAVLLTAGGISWMVLLQGLGPAQADGAGSLAQRCAIAAVLVLVPVFLLARATLPVADRLGRLQPGPSLNQVRLVLAGMLALAASTAVAVSVPLTELLAGGRDPLAGPIPVEIARDGLVCLVITAPLALAAVSVLTRAPSRPWSRRRSRTLAIGALVGLLVALAGNGVAVAAPAPAAAAPPANSVCPAGAATKTFGIRSIDLNTPVNRFGDHDPAGKMYVLTDIDGHPNLLTPPGGATAPALDAVRAEEQSQAVSIGLRDDPIQPLVIRANEGDCVKIHFVNDASGGRFGVHIDGLAFQADSSGDAVGGNPDTSVARGGAADYTFFVPLDVNLEGAHYLHPGPGQRAAVGHGLFGSLVVEPPGSTYLDSNVAGAAISSGWEATIVPAGRPSFRENVQLYHELGNENTVLLNKKGLPLPQVDPHTDAYRPGTRLMNYRTEPFMNRLDGPNNASIQESQGYGSYTFGDPATPMPRGYLGDPMKFRILHAGSEVFHVFHLHGGGIRWRFNPHSDPTYDYAATGLNKHPVELSDSQRLDSQSFGPGESYDLEIEGGSGGVQQGAGEFLFHCHIAAHYIAGMWSLWRVYNTLQPDFVPLPDRASNLPPIISSVPSSALIGRNFNGVTLTAQNLDAWIRPQLPPPGVRLDQNDAAVWNWTVDASNPSAPVYLGEPEDTTNWPDYNNPGQAHPTAFPGDVFVGNRPQILFNPVNGRIAWPLLRPHIGQRPPFSPNGHSGAPYLGENAGAAARTPAGTPDPFAGRADGLCSTGSTPRKFNVTALDGLPIKVTSAGGTDPNGMLFVLSKNLAKVRSGAMPAEPLAIRANVGDCVAVTLTSEQHDANQASAFAKVNMHIHHVQFDTQASDGVITGLSYEQSVRPYQATDTQLAAVAAAGATTLRLTRALPKLRPGVFVAVGEGTDTIEVSQIAAVAGTTLTLARPLTTRHPAGSWTGTEYTQYRWYPDVELDNIFWHDHVDGIHNWGHGLVGQLIIEPPGSTYHDPRTGAQVDSGTQVDIHATKPLIPGKIDRSFREQALWTIDDNPVTDATLNLRAAPFADRGLDPATRFSSAANGDPNTPLPRAYPGDPLVIRTINVGPTVDALHIDGHQVQPELRYPGDEGTPVNTIHYGISERFTLALEGGAGGPTHQPGDYLYMNSVDRHIRQGAWGIIRVLPGAVPDLKPLPGVNPATPAPACPNEAPVHTFAVTAVDVPSGVVHDNKVRAAFVPTSLAQAVLDRRIQPEPLVLHAAQGECVKVTLANRRALNRVSFHADGLQRDAADSGITIGNGPDNTVAPGGTRDYTLFADSARTGAALVSDFGGDDTGKIGLYGSINVAPPGATFTDPVTGAPTDVGSQVDVHTGGTGYRDFTAILSDDDPRIGQSHMPYPNNADQPALVNYQTVATQLRPIDDNLFSSAAHGDPNTPVFRGYAGDPTQVHVLVAPGGEQPHVINLGGQSWQMEPGLTDGQAVQSRGVLPWESLTANVIGGLGGPGGLVGDLFYGDLRRPFTEAGMWGLFRSLPTTTCVVRPLDGRSCGPPG